MEAENQVDEGKVDKLISHVIECAETRFDIVAIEIQDKVSEILASIASIAVVVILMSFVVLLASIGAAMYISNYFQSAFIGFFYVAAFYFLLSLIVIFTRKSLIKIPIINSLLKKINFHEED